VESVNWRIVDECEVRFFLCDARDKDVVVPFTESIQINLRAGRAPQTPFKFLFTVRNVFQCFNVFLDFNIPM